MSLTVTKEAANWYIKEMHLKTGDSLKYFGKVYGPHNGFSFAIQKIEPVNPYQLVTVEGIDFFVEAFDEWFFHDKDLEVTMRQDGTEPDYIVTQK